MAHVISKPIEDLIHEHAGDGRPEARPDRLIAERDVVIVGSGYGASIAATKLAGLRKESGEDVSVLVLERGREYSVGEFPTRLGDLPGHVRTLGAEDTHPTGYADALFDVRRGEDVDVLVGNGLGGGSLINANVAARPAESVFESWPADFPRAELGRVFDEIERLLGATGSMADPTGDPGDPRRRGKYAAFRDLGLGLAHALEGGERGGVDLGPRPAPITVTEGDDTGGLVPNAVGIGQPPCTRCGNCVTGCNVGAKNTLMMNLIPLAHDRGVEFVTGAHVLRVTKTGDDAERRWTLEVQRTKSIKTPLEAERFLVRARYVVLAAGALGSTEILLRSHDDERLRLSERLGRGFSTNGDALAFSWAQRRPVRALGTHRVARRDEGPGPTITGMVQGRLPDDDAPFTLEDGAIPAALVRVFGEALVTGAQLNRIGTNALPQAVADRDGDPLAADRAWLERAQVLLMMTDDGAQRSLELSEPTGWLDDAQRCAVPKAPSASDDDAPPGGEARPPPAAASAAGTPDLALQRLDQLDDRFSGMDRSAAFDGGQYVASPAFRALPKRAAGALGGAMPARRHVSVHALGGCAMADSVARGVVDAAGRVFDRDGGVHGGLFVLDGAALPTALATNPFLTIAAVSWLGCDALLEGELAAEGWRPRDGLAARARATPPGLVPDAAQDAEDPPEPRLVVREQLRGRLLGAVRPDLDEILAGGRRLFERDGLLLRLEAEEADAPVDDPAAPPARGPIRAPESFAAHRRGAPIRLHAHARLYVNPHSAAEVADRVGTADAAWVDDAEPVAEGPVTVTFLEPDRPRPGIRGWPVRAWRGAAALWAFLRRRRISLSQQDDASLLDQLLALARIAAMHASHRRFDYDADLAIAGGGRVRFRAAKRIRYAPCAERLWDSLLVLPVPAMTFERGGRSVTARARLAVDAAHLFDEGLIQVRGSDDVVESAMSAVSLVAFFGRCLLETGFWELAAPDYPSVDAAGTARERRLAPPPPLADAAGRPVAPERHELEVPLRPSDRDAPGSARLELHRWRPPSAEHPPPVLLIHGLAQGSAIFTSPRMRHNMAGFFLERDCDVWVLDHRLSNRFEEDRVPFDGWGVDAIGAEDVPRAIRRVRDATGRPVRVFAHCVGAIGVQMAILSGRLRPDADGPLVESVCFNAIHPWLVPAPANRARGKLGAFAQTSLPASLLDPILPPVGSETGFGTLVDRLASSLARIGESGGRRAGERREGEERDDDGHVRPRGTHFGVCDRMTALYGRMWRHENLEPSLVEGWAELVGRAPMAVYLQLHSMIERERILDDEGCNAYLTSENLRAHWRDVPTFFLHGDWSDVFDARSATRSAARLRRILARGGAKPPLIRLKRIPGYGHMDPILAKHAHERSYPLVHRFFEDAARGVDDASTSSTESRPAGYDDFASVTPSSTRRTRTGRALRAAWISRTTDPDGGDRDAIVLRHWMRGDRFNADPPVGARIQVGDGAGAAPAQAGPFHPDPQDGWVAFVDERTDPARPFVPREVDAASSDDQAIAPTWVVREDDEARDPDDDADRGARAPTFYDRLVARLHEDEGADGRLSMIVGSCRYPGTPVEAELSDAIFAGMLRYARRHPIDLAFLLGDQIYADAYGGLFDRMSWRDRYEASYRRAFDTPHMRRLLGTLPVHFAIDDHEIVDDWSGSAPARRRLPGGRAPDGKPITVGRISPEQSAFAVRAARLAVGSGRDVRRVADAPAPAEGALWYALDHEREVPFPCFVLDSRSERELRSIERYDRGRDQPTMLREGQGAQLDALLAWLVAAHDDARTHRRPKLVFAGQVIGPFRRTIAAHPATFRQHDGFLGYPATLARIVECIVGHGIRNVVFVGGDQHLSSIGRLELAAGGDSAIAWQIVASGLYAPMPFTNARPDEFDWGGGPPVVVQAGRGDVRVGYRGRFVTTQRSHFVHVDLTHDRDDADHPWTLRVSAHGPDAREARPRGDAWASAADDLKVRFE